MNNAKCALVVVKKNKYQYQYLISFTVSYFKKVTYLQNLKKKKCIPLNLIVFSNVHLLGSQISF